jgi:hypothetical protein
MSDKKTIRDRVVDPGYRCPDTQPSDIECIRVRVPKDTLYIGAFWGHLEKLGYWLSWERGGQKAKDAATLWKACISQSREEYELRGGACDDTADPFELPEVYDPDDPDSKWEFYADVIWSFYSIAHWTTVYFGNGGTVDGARDHFNQLITHAPGLSNWIQDFHDNYTQEEREALDTGTDWNDAIDYCVRCWELWPDSFEEFCVCMLEVLGELFDNATNELINSFHNTITTMAFFSLPYTAVLFRPRPPEFDISEPTCEWEHIFNWDANSEGWTNFYIASQTPHYLGHLVTPDGWVMTEGVGVCDVEIQIIWQQGMIDVDRVSVLLHVPVAYAYRGIVLYKLDNLGNMTDLGHQTYSQGDNSYYWNSVGECYGLKITFYESEGGVTYVPATLMDIGVTGQGFNPW